jgi:hypothetical protein
MDQPSQMVRGYIVNLALDANDDTRVLSLPFRPQPLEQSGGANYSDVAPVGGSCEYQIFANRTNDEVPVEIYWNALMMNTMRAEAKSLAELSAEINTAKRFIEALTVPYEITESMSSGSAPACLLVIPGWCRCRARLRTYKFTGEECDMLGNVIELRASLAFKIAPTTRATMKAVMQTGILYQGA